MSGGAPVRYYKVMNVVCGLNNIEMFVVGSDKVLNNVACDFGLVRSKAWSVA